MELVEGAWEQVWCIEQMVEEWDVRLEVVVMENDEAGALDGSLVEALDDSLVEVWGDNLV